tara:strand:+ start:298 stop:555 length:258 start_codon:yes stop_codon:yes gene_type:complete
MSDIPTAQEAARRADLQTSVADRKQLAAVAGAILAGIERGADQCFVTGNLSRKVNRRLLDKGYTVVFMPSPRPEEACTRIEWRRT